VLLVNGWAPHPAMKVHGSMYQAGMHCSSQKKGQKLVEVVGQPLGARMGQPLGARMGQPLGARMGQPLGARMGQPLGARMGQPLGARVGAGERAQHPSDPPLSMPGRHLSNPKIEAMIT